MRPIKKILLAPVLLILEILICCYCFSVNIIYRLFARDVEEDETVSNHYDDARILEKRKFETIVDLENRRIRPEYLQHRECPLCGLDSHIHFFSTQDFAQYVKCIGCGFIYSPDLLTFKTRQILYEGEEGVSLSDILISDDAVESDIRRFRPLLKMIKKHKADGAMLDVGCGIGTFLYLAKDSGFSVQGVETRNEFARRAKEKFDIEVYEGLFEEPFFSGKRYNVVTMWETLEHIYDPKNAIKRSSEVLEPGGILAISVPNCANLGFRILREYLFNRGCEHVNFFTAETLSKLLSMYGFEILEWHTLGGSPWGEILKLLNADLRKIRCYNNYESLNEPEAPASLFPAAETFFLKKIFRFFSRYEEKTRKGAMLVMLAKKTK